MPRKVNMHRSNGFGLGVYGGTKLDNGDIEMTNGQIYSIKLENCRDTIAEVVLKIEGKVVGTFLLYPYYKIEIERPVDLPRKFTFYKLNKLPGNKISQYSPCHYSNYNNGLIEAIFTPTLPHTYNKTRFTQEPDSTYHNYTDGITAFTVPSRQTFTRYHRYMLDTSNRTFLDIKLVGQYDLDYFPTHTSYPYPYIWYDNPTPLYEPVYDDEPYIKSHEECTHCCKCVCRRTCRCV